MRPRPECPVCGAPGPWLWRTLTLTPATDLFWHLCLGRVLPRAEIRQEVRLCRRCGAVYRTPQWDEAELAALYSAETWALVEPYRPRGGRAQANNEARRRRIEARILAAAPPRQPGGPAPVVADVGGRDGFYVAPFLERGWRALTVDSAASDPADPRIERHAARLEEARLPPLDAVLLSHVLEHLTEPGAFLARVRAALRPGGVVYAEVPYEVHRVLLCGDLGDPSHQVYFPTRTLGWLFRAAGFDVGLCARERSTYDLADLWAVVVVASPAAAPGPAPPPPGALHALAELLAPGVLAEALRGRQAPPAPAAAL